ncbi:MAG: hypothetical protein ABJC19_12255 [Gemmatimonadota bacterium]
MRRVALLVSVVALAACGRKDDTRSDSTMTTMASDSTTAPAATAATPAPESFAGEWDLSVMPMDNDSTLTTSHLSATATSTGWTMTLPGRPPVPLAVTFSGDSVMTIAPSYESVLRKGVMVSTSSVFRRNGNNLNGTTVAKYTTTGADSLMHLRSIGRRAPK